MINERYKKLKKRLIGSAIRAAVMIGGCGLCFGVAVFFYQNQTTSLKKLKNQEREAQSSVNKLKTRNERTKSTMALYESLIKDSSLRELGLSRKNISQLLTRLSDKYTIEDVLINISPIIEQKSDNFSPKTGQLITSDITIKYNATSDAHAFVFAEELFQNFSGYLNIKNFSIGRKDKISEDNLREILVDGKTEFFSTNLQFEWLGLQPNAPNEGAGGAR